MRCCEGWTGVPLPATSTWLRSCSSLTAALLAAVVAAGQQPAQTAPAGRPQHQKSSRLPSQASRLGRFTGWLCSSSARRCLQPCSIRTSFLSRLGGQRPAAPVPTPRAAGQMPSQTSGECCLFVTCGWLLVLQPAAEHNLPCCLPAWSFAGRLALPPALPLARPCSKVSATSPLNSSRRLLGASFTHLSHKWEPRSPGGAGAGAAAPSASDGDSVDLEAPLLGSAGEGAGEPAGGLLAAATPSTPSRLRRTSTASISSMSSGGGGGGGGAAGRGISWAAPAAGGTGRRSEHGSLPGLHRSPSVDRLTKYGSAEFADESPFWPAAIGAAADGKVSLPCQLLPATASCCQQLLEGSRQYRLLALCCLRTVPPSGV